jgi:predicted homoserine dehydrogenase-like protein
MGLSRGGKIINPVAKDALVTFDDVELDETPLSFRLRKTLEEESVKTKT